MCVNEIWCSICCRYMDESCKKCSHFDEQMHMDAEDKVDPSPEHRPYVDKGTGMITGEDPKDKEKRMTNFDKLLEDPESREAIIAVVSLKYCINKNEMTVNGHFRCDVCEFYGEGRNCDDVIFDWLQEEYIEGGEE